jgi:hypothetical protein
LHALLAHELGLDSPLGQAVATLDRAAGLAFNRTTGLQSAQAARSELARAVATGQRPFDEAAVAEYDAGRVWISDGQSTPASTELAEAAVAAARQAAVGEMAVHAPQIFDTLAAEARRVVDGLVALGEPPKTLFGAGDPGLVLNQTDGHEATYGALMRVSQRFWSVTRGADAVRAAAGHGYERFPDGAPRLAGTYRNWRKAMADAADLTRTGRHVRLWRTVVEGWEPGVWKPSDIETIAEDRTFAAKLRRFGGAVTGAPSLTT